MATYVKYTNGGVSFLVDINDQVDMDEKEAAKFEIETDSEGEIVTVDSKDLFKDTNTKTAEILESIKRKAAKKAGKTAKVVTTTEVEE
jgi:hypothetical protein